MQASGGVLGTAQALPAGREPTEREDRSITRGDEVGGKPRPPHLDERRVLPGGRLGSRHAGVDREKRRAACCPAGRPTPRARARICPAAAARRARPPSVGAPGLAPGRGRVEASSRVLVSLGQRVPGTSVRPEKTCFGVIVLLVKKHVVILGAGFGGLELATRLSESLAEDVRVTLIDRNDSFSFGFRSWTSCSAEKPQPR